MHVSLYYGLWVLAEIQRCTRSLQDFCDHTKLSLQSGNKFNSTLSGRPEGNAVVSVIRAYLEQNRSNVILLNWEYLAANVRPSIANSYTNWAAPNARKVWQISNFCVNFPAIDLFCFLNKVFKYLSSDFSPSSGKQSVVQASKEWNCWEFTIVKYTHYNTKMKLKLHLQLGVRFADVLQTLEAHGLDLNRTHLVGHSLGAQLFGIAGNTLTAKGVHLPW